LELIYLKDPLQRDLASPLGIVLCSGKKQEQIELLELDASGIHVAEYLTTLPPREVLQAKLHRSHRPLTRPTGKPGGGRLMDAQQFLVESGHIANAPVSKVA